LRRYVVGETAEALAKRFGMSENTVVSRLYRARGKLRKQLRKENIRI
jgi:DNA-directed RNA polymerase specialized sigma24 family protein